MILFRDTYKSAMDDIKPDSDLLGTILSRTGESEKRPFHGKRWIYSVGACAASFLLVTCSVINYNKFSNVNELPAVVSQNENVKKTNEVYQTNKADERIKSSDNENGSKNEVEANTQPSASANVKISSNDIANEVRQKNDDAKTVNETSENHSYEILQNEIETQENSAETETGVYEFENSDTTEDNGLVAYSAAYDAVSEKKRVLSDNDASADESARKSVGAGSSAASGTYSEMTVSQYAEYIGINVSEYLPDGFSYCGEDILCVGTDGSATQSFAADDGRMVSITLTKDADGMKTVVENTQMTRLTDTAVCNVDDDVCTVYGYGKTTGYIISTNLTKNEVKRLAESISK